MRRLSSVLPVALLLAASALAPGSASAASGASGQLGLTGFRLLASSVHQAPPRMPTGREVLPPHVERAKQFGAGQMPPLSASVPRLGKTFVPRGRPPGNFRDLSRMRVNPIRIAGRILPRGVAVLRAGWGGRIGNAVRGVPGRIARATRPARQALRNFAAGQRGMGRPFAAARTAAFRAFRGYRGR